jgi:hypothetical protein
LRDRATLVRALLWPTGDADARGYEAIEARAASAYEHWVGSEGPSFRGRDDAERLGDVVKFHWEALAKDGEAFGVGSTSSSSSRTAGSSATTRSSRVRRSRHSFVSTSGARSLCGGPRATVHDAVAGG